MKILPSYLRQWLPLAVVISMLCLGIYIAAQQSYRQAANDPQIQIAEDVSQALEADAQSLPTIMGSQKIDLAHSLDVFIMVVNHDGTLLGSTAVLNGQPVQPPLGALQHATESTQHRLTWQPQPGIRQAIVIQKSNYNSDSYVIVGRSLREVENRVTNLGHGMLVGWIGTLLISLAACFIVNKRV